MNDRVWDGWKQNNQIRLSPKGEEKKNKNEDGEKITKER